MAVNDNNNDGEYDNLVELYEIGKYELIEAFEKMKSEHLAMKKENESNLLAVKKEILAMKEEKDEQILAMKREIDEERKNFLDFKSLLRTNLECPVCLEVPTSGPIAACPNGHLVCSKCKQNLCPTCRVKMWGGKSLLAVTVIENIEHKCKNEGCKELFPLSELEKHIKICQFRIISCPAPSDYCQKKVAFCQVLDHILSDCKGSVNKDKGGEIIIYTMPQTRDYRSYFPIGDFCMNGAAFQWNEHFFYLNRESADGASLFSIQHFGDEEDCKKFKVEIKVHQTGDKEDYVQKFVGEPLAMDITEHQRKKNGLVVGDILMKKISVVENEVWKFSVTYDIKQ